jgi:hypothetical protein
MESPLPVVRLRRGWLPSRPRTQGNEQGQRQNQRECHRGGNSERLPIEAGGHCFGFFEGDLAIPIKVFPMDEVHDKGKVVIRLDSDPEEEFRAIREAFGGQ